MYAKVHYKLENAVKAATVSLLFAFYLNGFYHFNMPERWMLPPLYGCGNRAWEFCKLIQVSQLTVSGALRFPPAVSDLRPLLFS